MSAFEKWLIEQGFPTDPLDHAMHAAFNAGMTRATEIVDGLVIPDSVPEWNSALFNAKDAILKARDASTTSLPPAP